LIVHANNRASPQPQPEPVLALKGAVSPLGVDHGLFTGGTSPLQALTNKVGGAGYRWLLPGESTRSRKIAPVRARRPPVGTRRFATLHSACPRDAAFLRTAGRTYRVSRHDLVQWPEPDMAVPSV